MIMQWYSYITLHWPKKPNQNKKKNPQTYIYIYKYKYGLSLGFSYNIYIYIFNISKRSEGAVNSFKGKKERDFSMTVLGKGKPGRG